jgi:hypothetical protein
MPEPIKSEEPEGAPAGDEPAPEGEAAAAPETLDAKLALYKKL